MDPVFESGYGDFHLQETSPCIDAGDPANPVDPDGTIADQGALYYIAPSVVIDLTAINPPIFIPSSGGSFNFNIEVENISGSAVVFDVWTTILTPTGSVVGPIILRTGASLPVGGSQMRTLTQNVPGTAPPGYYSYRGYVGTYPLEVQDDDYFNFAKLSDDSGPTGYFDDWSVTGWEEESVTLSAPAEFALNPAYPNPFNPETHLSFTLPEAGTVSLIVYDMQGRAVATLYDGWYSAGQYQATFGAAGLPSGVYFARLTANGSQQTQKLMLMK
jgi:hypothetical protein